MGGTGQITSGVVAVSMSIAVELIAGFVAEVNGKKSMRSW